MPALFDQGFFVRVPAWHELGVVLDDYSSREEAMKLAGHDFDVVELPSFTVVTFPEIRAAGLTNEQMEEFDFVTRGNSYVRRDDGWVTHVRSDTLALLHKTKDTYERIPNSVAYDVAELLFDQGFQYETGITLEGGKTCAITLMLDEPIEIPGDDSPILPYGCLSWSHDGTGALKVRSGTIRQVCANTVSASEAEGKRLGTDFTFRHTKNVNERIEEAKEAIKGVRKGLDVYREVMCELSTIEVTPEQRDTFVSDIIGDRDGILSKSDATSSRVKTNIEKARTDVLSLFMGPTIPESHQLTGYGLFQAGTEYFDHLRAYQTKESYVKRTLLSENPAKASLAKTIRELVAA